MWCPSPAWNNGQDISGMKKTFTAQPEGKDRFAYINKYMLHILIMGFVVQLFAS